MKQVAMIEFQDTESKDEGIAIVRGDERSVGLSLSLKKDGDVEVFLPLESARALIAALQEAVSIGSKR